MSVIGRRHLASAGLAVAGVIIALGVSRQNLEGQAKSGAPMAPVFEVDPLWPKPLPNHWVLGSVIGVTVNSKDHVIIVHRGDSTLNQRTEAGANATPPTGECCVAAPPVLEF